VCEHVLLDHLVRLQDHRLRDRQPPAPWRLSRPESRRSSGNPIRKTATFLELRRQHLNARLSRMVQRGTRRLRLASVDSRHATLDLVVSGYLASSPRHRRCVAFPVQ
jgi:hypothetical protein